MALMEGPHGSRLFSPTWRRLSCFSTCIGMNVSCELLAVRALLQRHELGRYLQNVLYALQ